MVATTKTPEVKVVHPDVKVAHLEVKAVHPEVKVGRAQCFLSWLFLCLGQPLECPAHSKVESSPEANLFWQYITDRPGICLLGDY